MSDPSMFISHMVLLAGLAIVAIMLLRAWHAWLDLKRVQLGESRSERSPNPKERIELADLKERVRRLEAIANGIET